MTQEEKARAYDEAIKRAKEINNEQKAQPFDIMLKVFPELKEDNEDERIRKELITHCRNTRCVTEEGAERIAKWIAWLEKQGKQDTDISSFPEEQQVFMRKYVSLDKITLIKLLAERDANNAEIIESFEKQGEQNEIFNVPSREVILSIWDLGNEWKELTNGSISTEYGTQLDYIQKYWQESEYYLRAKQSEQKSFDYESANIQNKDFAPESTPRYSIGDVLCDKSCTTLNKESQPNFKIIDIRNGMYICDKCSFPISQQDEYELVAKRIEQKPADKVEPKFHEGDWIIHYGTENIYKVVAIIDNQYQLKYGDNYTVQNCTDVDRCARLWDIAKDAKYGDVLSDGTTIFIFKDLLSDGSVMSYCDYDADSGESDAFCPLSVNLVCSKITPATKEQRDTLLKAMVDAGYMWDSENKILLSLKAEPNSEQKPAGWSEEDERHKNTIIRAIHGAGNITPIDGELAEKWLKSLRLQKRWKPSEEQLDALREALSHIPDEYDTPILTEIYEQLKQL